ncbi:MAG: endonuclease/exonuclease/phosphatase family protein [Bacteroidales bacterium]
MLRKFLSLLIIGILGTVTADLFADKPAARTIMFYNCENLLDPFDDPRTNDNEFLPHSRRNWTFQKYQQKLEHISKVILATGTEPPVVIGLAEVENAFVLNQLSSKTGLARFNYKVIHHDSPDPRGIDVGVLYRPAYFRVLGQTFYRVGTTTNRKNDQFQTRDIVYLKGILCLDDTLHIFYNHWPSRRSSAKGDNKEAHRITVAKVLRSKVDSILQKNGRAQIIIMGDFNDEPDNISIVRYLGAHGTIQPTGTTQHLLFNWSAQWKKNIAWLGTYKYKNQWHIFDQIITSYALVPQLASRNKCVTRKAEIFAPTFLLVPDEKYGTRRPFRTYNSMKYAGGFSDHLPVLLTLECPACQAR